MAAPVRQRGDTMFPCTRDADVKRETGGDKVGHGSGGMIRLRAA
jgi:hypothetical protein